MLPHLKTGSSTEQFEGLLDRYAGFVAMAGKKTYRSSSDESHRLFQALDETRRTRVIERLQSDISVYEEMIAAKEELTNSKRILWRFLSRAGITPCSDIFDKIGDTDIVEVYGPNHIHLSQNFNFFDWISVTLDRIFCEAWHETTRRDPIVAKTAYETISRIMTGEFRNTFDPQIPWHWLEELDSELLFKFQIHIKWASPIFYNRQVTGFILVNECRDLESLRK
jgi:hypothetical protein